MSLSNDQITAKNFKEFYEKIRPYLGGMPDILANKFSKGDMYSTDEKMIGQWIDGKPLYRKTIHCGYLPNASYKDVPVSVTNLDALVDIRGIFGSDGVVATMPYVDAANSENNVSINYRKATSVLRIRTAIDYSTFSGAVTIQYTKTTDSAISIGDDTDYSTTEKIVGTWIDGKSIYQKTFVINEAITLTTNEWVSTPIPKGDIETIVSSQVVLNDQSHHTYITVSVDSNSTLWMLSVRPEDKTFSNFKVTLQYTKTTD